jgi:hypothetical protein
VIPTGQFAFKSSAKLTRPIFQGASSSSIDKREFNTKDRHRHLCVSYVRAEAEVLRRSLPDGALRIVTMPSVTAKRQCPDLIFVKPRFEVYDISRHIRSIFAKHTPVMDGGSQRL